MSAEYPPCHSGNSPMRWQMGRSNEPRPLGLGFRCSKCPAAALASRASRASEVTHEALCVSKLGES